MRRLLGLGLMFVAGLIVGGMLLRNAQPRSFAALDDCGGHCYRPADLAGLMVSAGLRLAPGAMPNLVRETSTCVAIASPFPKAKKHFVLFPKRDIRSVADIAASDAPWVMGCFDLARALISDRQIMNYRVETNGPGRQAVAYLHWHLMGD